MLIGIALTLVLTVLSFVRVSPSGISYRAPEIWSNQATLVLTQEGAPELRSVLPSGAGGLSTSLAETGRFASLIDVYAALATGDAVVRDLRRRGLVDEKDMQTGALPITAAAVPSTVNAATPMMTITGTATTGPEATKLTLAATRAFLDVLHRRQLAADIPVKDRIQVRIVKSSDAPTLIDPRSKALPILVLLSGLIATAAVAFSRENLARREGAPVLTTIGSRAEPTEAEAHAASAVSHSHSHSHSTLEPVPRAESPAHDVPDSAPQRAPRAPARATIGTPPAEHESRWAGRRGRSASS